jgi:phage terminase large subunit-like protein
MTLTALSTSERIYSANWLASQTAEKQAAFLNSLTPTQLNNLAHDWQFWARDKQLPPASNWRYWVILAGRGFGKTRTGAEWVRSQVQRYSLVNLIGATASDARDIMIEGESGLLAICPPDERPEYRPSKARLEWPNGAKSLIFTADEPERLRGKQHMKLWCDELAAWRYPEAWTQAMLGLRLGDSPQACVTTTPKPVKILLDLLKHPKAEIVTGTTYENRSNLADDWFGDIISQYEGTRLGQQELLAEIITDVPGALWQRHLLDMYRVKTPPLELLRIVVAVDPAVTSTDESSETGIIVAALDAKNRHGYVLEDVSVTRGRPEEWARVAVNAYHRYKADRIIGEVNNGGEMVESTIRTVDPLVSYKAVRASRSKQTRAEPISSLYEQGRVHHVGTFAQLESQLCTWVPGEKSPDRLDAMVWALTELMLSRRGGGNL